MKQLAQFRHQRLDSARSVERSLAQRAVTRMRVATVMLVAVVSMTLVLPALALAQQAGVIPTILTWQDAVVYLLPIIVPILVAAAKKVIYTTSTLADGTVVHEPPVWLPKWTIPLSTPLIGILLTWLSTLGSTTPDFLMAGVFGALGVFVREVTKPLFNR